MHIVEEVAMREDAWEAEKQVGKRVVEVYDVRPVRTSVTL